MTACTNHPMLEATGPCARCGMPFCAGCLVEFLGSLYCGPCRNAKLAEAQGLGGMTGRLMGTGAVPLGQWISDGLRIFQQDMGAFVIGALLGSVLTAVTCGVLTAPLMCGISMMAFRKILNPTAGAGSVMDGCRRFLWAFLALALIATAISILQVVGEVPSIIIRTIGRNSELLQALASLYDVAFGVVANVLVTGATFFVFADIAATNVNPIDAIRRSWEVTRRNLPMFCLAGAVCDLISLLGLPFCLVGALFTFPIAIAIQAQAYADHFGLEQWQDPSLYVPPAPYAAP